MASTWSDGSLVRFPIVVKYSGLADGKGVFMCETKAEALRAIYMIQYAKKDKAGKIVKWTEVTVTRNIFP